MKILLINYEYPPVGAGAATATQQIAKCLVLLGHTPLVLTVGFGSLRGLSQEQGVQVIRLNTARRRPEASSIFEMATFCLSATRKVRKMVRKERVDGIIAFFSIPSGPVAYWGHRGTGVPYVVSLRGGDVPGTELGLGLAHTLLSPLRRTILRSARAVVANSPSLKALSEATDPVHVEVISNGVDTDFFRPRPIISTKREPFRFLFVGRFQSQKNLPWMLAQLAILATRSEIPFTVELVGDGPQRSQLEALAQRLDLSARLRWHGWLPRDRLVSIYQQADAILNPSLYEGMPNVLLEGMASGLPVLASNVPGNDAVVAHGITGHLFALGDSADFIACAERWIDGPSAAARMGDAGRLRVIKEFSWLSCTKSYLGFFSLS